MKNDSYRDFYVLLNSVRKTVGTVAKKMWFPMLLFGFTTSLLADNNYYPEEKGTSPTVIHQQNRGKVTGTITDSAGEPIIGANVSIQGTTVGTITDIDGKYSLEPVQNGQIIQISYIGYIPQEIAYTGQGDISIALNEDLLSLEEVVIVGYATVKKANLTGAVSAIDDKVLKDRPIVNLGQGLQGAIPNLNITTSGRPGDGSSYNIRGYTSINGGNPLVLVDGIERDPNLINPQDVQSVSVLKDAASASIYGARAAFGVILITTKGGRTDQPAQVSFDATLSFNSPTTRPTYMSSWDYATWMNKASNNTTGNDYFDAEWMQHIKAYYDDPVNNLPVFVHSNPSISNSGRKYSYAGNTDWMKAMYKNSYPVQKYNVNIRGGSKKATYYSSVGYTDQSSLIRWGNEKYRIFNMVNNISYDVKKWMNISIKNSYTRTELNGLNQNHIHGDNWIGGDTRPIMPVKHPDGTWAGQGNFTNFAAVLEDGGSRKTTKNDLWNTFALKLMPVEGLSLNMDYTFNYYGEHRKIHGKEFSEYGVDGQFLQSFVWNIPNYAYEWQNNDTYNAFNLFGDYELNLDKHYFKVLAGFNQESKHTRSFYAQRDELISNDLPSMGAATGEKYAGNDDNGWATRSGFFRLNYTFNDRYLLELNGRYDLSSKFPKKDRAVFNPSFSAGWKISEEDWFKSPTGAFFDELKIRGSYGSLGNQALSNGWYAYISSYGTGNTSWLFNSERLTYVSSGALVSNTIT